MYQSMPNTLTSVGTLLPGDVVRFVPTGDASDSPLKHSEVVAVRKVAKHSPEYDVTLKEFLGERWTGRERTMRFHGEFVLWLLGTHNKAVRAE